jgi:hypothetical protein
MNNSNTYNIRILDLLVRFLGTILIIAFIVPAVAVSQSSPEPVNLRTSGDFVILSKTGITTTGTTQITGDIGVSPIDAGAITGFGLIMDASNTFSTSSLVTGKVYASDYTDPTPTKMTTAIGDMETAYTDAAGRKLPDNTELYLGNLTGQTLKPGLYNWSTGVQVSSSGEVTISGTATDIWIFQIAQDLTLTSGAIVTLGGSAQASNIFWQVAGQVSLGTTVAMKGIILCQTKIVMSTGASLLGRALAQTAVTLDANAVTSPGTINSIGADGKQMPDQFTLEQNFPNPFNPTTMINYSIAKEGQVRLTVFNAIGNKVATIVNENKPAGNYSIQLNGSNLASGIYLYRLESGNFSATKKFMLLK